MAPWWLRRARSADKPRCRVPVDRDHTMVAMQVLRVTGGARLSGQVPVVGAKNSVLKLMAASLLAEGRTTIGNLPAIADVDIMNQLLQRLGCRTEAQDDGLGESVVIDVPARPSSDRA